MIFKQSALNCSGRQMAKADVQGAILDEEDQRIGGSEGGFKGRENVKIHCLK